MSSNKWYEESYVQLLFFRKLQLLDFSVVQKRHCSGHLANCVSLKKTSVFSE